MELGLTVELGLLLDTYGELLTDKMREILTMYVCENMSYQEIGNYFGISKPAVLDAIRTSQNKLLDYESKIKMLALKKELQRLIAKNGKNSAEIAKILENF